MATERRALGFFGLLVLVVGNMIGSGIFLLPSSLARIGSVSLFSWVFTAIVAFCLSIIFSNMSVIIPKSGGPYAYTRSTLGNYIGFQAVLKFTPILSVGLMGWFYVDTNNFIDSINVTKPSVSNLSEISMGISFTLWAFIGLESATVPYESVCNPKRKIPLATIFGTTIVAIAYVLSSGSIMGLLSVQKLQHNVFPFSDAAQVLLGSWERYFISISVIVTCFGSLNGWVFLQGKVSMAAAQDGLFPEQFSRLNDYHVPARGLTVTSILTTLLLLLTVSDDLTKQFNQIILLAVFASIIPCFYTTIAEVICLTEENRLTLKRQALLLCCMVGFIYCSWAIYGLDIETVYLVFVFLLSSVPLYDFVKR